MCATETDREGEKTAKVLAKQNVDPDKALLIYLTSIYFFLLVQMTCVAGEEVSHALS